MTSNSANCHKDRDCEGNRVLTTAVTIIYTVLTVIALGLFIHSIIMRKKLRDIAKSISIPLRKEDHEMRATSLTDEEDEKYESLTWYLTYQLGKKPLLLKIQDYVQDNYLVGFLVVISAFAFAPFSLALVFLLYKAFGIDVITFLILSGFVVYIYVSEYPEITTYSRAINQMNVEQFNIRDKQILDKAITKLKLLQSNLLLLMPLFAYFIINYDVFLSTMAGTYGWLVLHVHAFLMSLFTPVLGDIIDGRYVYLFSLALTMFAGTIIVPIAGTLWKKTANLRSTLLP